MIDGCTALLRLGTGSVLPLTSPTSHLRNLWCSGGFQLHKAVIRGALSVWHTTNVAVIVVILRLRVVEVHCGLASGVSVDEIISGLYRCKEFPSLNRDRVASDTSSGTTGALSLSHGCLRSRQTGEEMNSGPLWTSPSILHHNLKASSAWSPGFRPCVAISLVTCPHLPVQTQLRAHTAVLATCELPFAKGRYLGWREQPLPERRALAEVEVSV